METKHGSLSVRTFDKDLEITNSRIKIRLFFRDGGYAQEFYAANAQGRPQLILTSLYKDLVPFSDFRTCSSPMIAGERRHLFGICRESLRMVYSNAEVTHHDDQRVEIKLSGSTQGHTLDCRMTLEAESDFVHVTVTDTFGQSARPPLIEYVMNSFAFVPGGQSIGSTNELDYVWSPALRPGNDCVIGDRTFHSPALVIQRGPEAAALIPDLKMLTQHRSMPAALDLDLDNGLLFAPLLSYGFCGYEYDPENKCFRHDITMAKRLGERRLVYGYDLLLDARCKRGAARQTVARFLWDRYGSATQTRAHAAHALEPLIPAPLTVTDARSALGLYHMGSERRSAEMVESAGVAVERLLAVPQDHGLFATKYDAEQNDWKGCNIPMEGAAYNTVECSEQLYWLLKWHSDVKPDKRIIAYCRRYADFLIESRLRTGAIPSWYSRELHPLPVLRSSIQTAAAVVFLAELARVTGLVKYKSAAERSASFVINRLVPGHDFLDHTFFDHRRQCSTHCSDPHSGCSPQSGRAMLWVAELCLALHDLTGLKKHRDWGVKVLDQLCLLQSVWNKPWEDTPGFGMLAGSNMGAEFDRELTLDFARCALGYAAATGNEEYAKRAEAAIQAVGETCDCRMQAGTADLRKGYGSIYVHVGKKWAICTDGVSIENVEFGRGELDMRITNRHTAGVVFGGMRGSKYVVNINGCRQQLSREQMEAGVNVPAGGINSGDARGAEGSQPKLFG